MNSKRIERGTPGEHRPLPVPCRAFAWVVSQHFYWGSASCARKRHHPSMFASLRGHRFWSNLIRALGLTILSPRILVKKAQRTLEDSLFSQKLTGSFGPARHATPQSDVGTARI